MKPNKMKLVKMNQNSQTQLIEDLIGVSEPGSLRSDAGQLKAVFYLDDLEGLVKHLVRKLRMKMDYEKTDAELRSIPKGKYKVGEDNKECVHREVCEEVGIEVDKYPHIYRPQGSGHIVIFNKPAEEIPLFLGPEINSAKWVDLNWLKNDIKNEIKKSNQVPTGTYPYKYNINIRKYVPKI